MIDPDLPDANMFVVYYTGGKMLQAQPDALFVGRLDSLPKFKGMEEGTTKWVRRMMDV